MTSNKPKDSKDSSLDQSIDALSKRELVEILIIEIIILIPVFGFALFIALCARSLLGPNSHNELAVWVLRLIPVVCLLAALLGLLYQPKRPTE